MTIPVYETRMMRPRGDTVKVTIVRAGVELIVDGRYCRLACGTVIDLPRQAADALLRSGAADRAADNLVMPTVLLEADSDA